MKIFVLALDGAFDTGLAVILDAFATANELSTIAGISSAKFDVTVIGVRKSITTSQGMTAHVRSIPNRTAPDGVVAPAIGYKMPPQLLAALDRPDTRKAVALLRVLSQQGAKTAAACIGTFLLAESGLLDHHA